MSDIGLSSRERDRDLFKFLEDDDEEVEDDEVGSSSTVARVLLKLG